MSEIPKDYTDNYSKNVKKIDSSGNLKAHPRAVAKKRKARSKRIREVKANPVVTPAPKSTFGKEVERVVDRHLLSGVGTSVKELKKKVGY